MHPEIKQALTIIRQRVSNLQHIERMLMEEFGSTEVAAPQLTLKPPTRTIRSAPNGGTARTRKDELIKYLMDNGPKRRSEINARSGIPVGTVANLLNGQEFVRLDDGNWDVRDSFKLAAPPVWNPSTEKGVQ